MDIHDIYCFCDNIFSSWNGRSAKPVKFRIQRYEPMVLIVIAVSGMTGGTGGSEKIFERMSHYGIGTEIGMHLGEKHREEAAKLI